MNLWSGRRLPAAYGRTGLRQDVVAAAVLTTLLLPAGMGYAEAAGLPAVTGLYATVAGLLAYALTGPTRSPVVGVPLQLIGWSNGVPAAATTPPVGDPALGPRHSGVPHRVLPWEKDLPAPAPINASPAVSIAVHRTLPSVAGTLAP